MANPLIQQNVSQIVENCTPEQKIMWQHLRLLTGENSAVQFVHFMGLIAGSEFLTYSANKLYFALRTEFSFSSRAVQNPMLYATFYDETNNARFAIQRENAYWDGTAAAARWSPDTVGLKNLYFSRIVTTYEWFIFTGFKLTR